MFNLCSKFLIMGLLRIRDNKLHRRHYQRSGSSYQVALNDFCLETGEIYRRTLRGYVPPSYPMTYDFTDPNDVQKMEGLQFQDPIDDITDVPDLNPKDLSSAIKDTKTIDEPSNNE